MKKPRDLNSLVRAIRRLTDLKELSRLADVVKERRTKVFVVQEAERDEDALELLKQLHMGDLLWGQPGFIMSNGVQSYECVAVYSFRPKKKILWVERENGDFHWFSPRGFRMHLTAEPAAHPRNEGSEKFAKAMSKILTDSLKDK